MFWNFGLCQYAELAYSNKLNSSDPPLIQSLQNDRLFPLTPPFIRGK